jgi:hypothetical protein
VVRAVGESAAPLTDAPTGPGQRRRLFDSKTQQVQQPRRQVPPPLGERLRAVLLGEGKRMVDRREHATRISARANDRRRDHHILRAPEDALAARHGIERRSPGNRAIAGRAEP